MKNQKPIVKAMAACLAGSFSSHAILAQEEPVFEEVIVTATKRAESIYDVPMAVSAFEEDTLFKQGITDLTDVGKFVPNMTVTGFSAGHVSSINVFVV